MGAVGEGEVELGAEEVWARGGAVADPRHGGAVPTAAEEDAEGVRTVGEERRYVICLVEDSLVEVGPSGGEEGVGCDGFAVEEGLVGSEGGEGEARGADGGVDGEVLAEE